MPYIGNSPGTGTRNRFIYTATASQTTFSGADDNGKTLKYADSDYVDVYLNGICLVPVTDYTSTSKTSIVLTQAASLNDTLEVVAYDIATISDTVSKANGGTFDSSISIKGTTTDSPALFVNQGTATNNFDGFLITSTNDGSSTAPDITTYRDSSTPADLDNLGSLWFYGNNDADERAIFSGVYGQIADVTDATEDGRIIFAGMAGGSIGTFASVDADGIKFNGDTAAENALDDYEEGTWTITTNGDSTGVLAANSEATYTKIGNQVTVHGVFQVSTNFSDNAIGGLPFNPYNPVNIVSSIHGVGAMQYSSSYAFTRIAHNLDVVRFYTAGGSSINPSTSNDPFRFVITYLTTT